MSARKRTTAVFMMTLLASTSFVAVAGPAYADRCEPLELIMRPVTGDPNWEDPADEEDSPVCYLLLNFVWPALCDDYSRLDYCLNTIDPDNVRYHLDNFVFPFICDNYSGGNLLQALVNCTRTVNPDPGYVPDVPLYQGDAVEWTCDYYYWVNDSVIPCPPV